MRGDDLLICDDKVALVYRSIVDELGVSISLSKSLISGCIEFAKRFYVNDLTLDLSPISVRCLVNFYHPYGLHAIRLKYPISRFSTFCRIGGVGYKSLAKINSQSSPKINFKRTLWLKALLPIEWWLGNGLPLNPYLQAQAIHYLRKVRKPKEPPPKEFCK